MRFKTGFLAAAFAAAASVTLAEGGHGIDTAAMDKTAVPGDDFFAYANGGWLKTVEIPADQSGWGAFTALREKAAKRTADLIEETAKGNAPAGSEAQKIGDFYASFMDEAGIEAKGLAPLKPELAAIAAIKNKTDVARAIGSAMRANVDALNNTNFYTENLFGVWVAPGFSDSALE